MKVILGSALLLFLMLFSVWEDQEIVNLGYATEEMRLAKAHQYERQQALMGKYYGLISLDRIERRATTQLGLVRPQAGQVILMSKQ